MTLSRPPGTEGQASTNHFASKEAFGLEILELYFANGREIIGETLRNDALPPLQRLGAWINANKNRLNRDGMRNGCLFGNFTAEASDHSELIRHRLVEIFAEVQQSVAHRLRAAVTAGELLVNTLTATRLLASSSPRYRVPTSWRRRSAARCPSIASSRFCSRKYCAEPLYGFRSRRRHRSSKTLWM